jgi:hypothetical protein
MPRILRELADQGATVIAAMHSEPVLASCSDVFVDDVFQRQAASPFRRVPTVTTGSSRFPAMKARTVLVVGSGYVALLAFLAEKSAWVSDLANSFVPFAAIPMSVSMLAARRSIAAGILTGAVSGAVPVLAFYAGSALSSPYALSSYGPVYWSLVGSAFGAVVGTSVWLVRPHIGRITWGWLALSASALLVAQLVVILGVSEYSLLAQILLVVSAWFWSTVVLMSAVAARGDA